MEATLVLDEEETRLVNNVGLFAGLEEADIAGLMRHVKRRRYRRGEVIYHTEDLPGSLYLVMKGALKLRLQSPGGKHLTMSWVTPGSFFGTISLLDGQERIADAVAVRSCELLVLGRDDFRAFLHEHPPQAEILLEITATRWRNTMRRLAELAFLDVPGRLARALLTVRRQPSSGEDDDRPEGISLTQAELAEFVGTSRESVGRWLKVFSDSGLVEVRRGSVVVTGHSGLERYIRW